MDANLKTYLIRVYFLGISNYKILKNVFLQSASVLKE